MKPLTGYRRSIPLLLACLADLPDISSVTPLSVSEAEVRSAVLSFPAGSSGGPDGIRPQHLKDLLSIPCLHDVVQLMLFRSFSVAAFWL